MVDQPVPSRQGEELDLPKLNTWLHATHPDISDIIGQKQFQGGYSNLTYLLVGQQKEYILRRPPFGAAIKSAHDMGREFKVLSLLRAHYNKVPTPLLFC